MTESSNDWRDWLSPHVNVYDLASEPRPTIHQGDRASWRGLADWVLRHKSKYHPDAVRLAGAVVELLNYSALVDNERQAAKRAEAERDKLRAKVKRMRGVINHLRARRNTLTAHVDQLRASRHRGEAPPVDYSAANDVLRRAWRNRMTALRSQL